MAEVSNLTINVSAQTDRATSSINSLVSALTSLKNNMADLTPQLTNFATVMGKVASDIRAIGQTGVKNVSFSSIADEDVSKNLEDIAENSNDALLSLKDFKAELRATSHEAKKSSSGLGKVASSFKRIVMYRALRSILRAIVNALKEGVTNVYQWSKAMKSAGYGQFAQSLDSLASGFQKLKNSLGAMVSPLINALAPAINWVINRLVDLFNILNQVFSFLTGQSYWLKPNDAAVEFAETTERAGGAAKELRDVLADFDEINLIDPGTSGGGGGGGGLSGLNTEDLFTPTAFDDIISKLQPLKDILDQIWPIIEQIADWVTTTLLPKVLEDVGFQLNNIFTDVKNIIDKIKEGDVLGVLNELKNLLVDLTFGPLDAIATVFDAIFGTNVQGFIRDIMKALKEFNLKKWLQDTWKAIQKIFPAFKKGGTFTKIGEEFKEIFGNMKKAFKDLGAGIKNAWEKAIKPVLSFLWDTLKKFFKWLKEKGVFDWLLGAVNSIVKIFASWAKTPFITTLDGLVNGIKTIASLLSGDLPGAMNGIKDLLSDLLIDVVQPFAETFDAIFGTDIGGWLKNLKKAIKDFDLGAWIEGIWEKVHQWINVDLISAFEAAFKWVKIKVEGLIKLAKGLWKGITEGDFSDWNAAAKEINLTFNDVLDTVKAKNLEIYNQAKMKAIKIDAITGRKPDATMTKLIEMPGGTKKSIIMQLKKDKADAWSKEAYNIFNAATKNSSYSVNVKVNASLNKKLAAKDIFKDTYINFRIGNNVVAKAQVMGHGGFLDTGDLFIANESAPEYVGSMNGKTAVANNQQIVDGVASGVFRAIVSTGIVDAVKKNKNGSAPVFAPSVEAGRWIQRSLNLYQTVG